MTFPYRQLKQNNILFGNYFVENTEKLNGSSIILLEPLFISPNTH